MHLYRTRFANDIVSEFLPPLDPETHEERTEEPNHIIVYCSGMPSVPDQEELMVQFASDGYWIFFPRYRGSWESEGELFENSPHQDILDVIDGIKGGFKELWNGKEFSPDVTNVSVIGSSFGGTAAILASLDSSVDRAVALSPVIDWRVESEDESLKKLIRFTDEAFGDGYRIAEKGWKKIKGGNFYNPINHRDDYIPDKLLILYSADDTVVPIYPIEEFINHVQCHSFRLKSGGHLGGSDCKNPKIYNRVTSFLHGE